MQWIGLQTVDDVQGPGCLNYYVVVCHFSTFTDAYTTGSATAVRRVTLSRLYCCSIATGSADRVWTDGASGQMARGVVWTVRLSTLAAHWVRLIFRDLQWHEVRLLITSPTILHRRYRRFHTASFLAAARSCLATTTPSDTSHLIDTSGVLSTDCFTRFLADRTNGRAYATVLRPSSSSVVACDVMYNVLWLNGAA